MILYRTTSGVVAAEGGAYWVLGGLDWDSLIGRDDAAEFVRGRVSAAGASTPGGVPGQWLLPPIVSQEVWGAGVTYERSRSARMEEARTAGGGDFYDRVYTAERPEVFFKTTPPRVVGAGQRLHLRSDSKWIVPEPELAAVVTPAGRVIGYTIANDLSCRDIEGANPLYLPQAKTFARCCALGPGILLTDQPLPPATEIRLDISRAGAVVYHGSTTLARMKRSVAELVGFLLRDNVFPQGAVLMTGTGIVPPDSFSLQAGDTMRIVIAPIGELINGVD